MIHSDQPEGRASNRARYTHAAYKPRKYCLTFLEIPAYETRPVNVAAKRRLWISSRMMYFWLWGQPILRQV
jgi:hypothetical protein